jgi:hypothetical protein
MVSLKSSDYLRNSVFTKAFRQLTNWASATNNKQPLIHSLSYSISRSIFTQFHTYKFCDKKASQGVLRDNFEK